MIPPHAAQIWSDADWIYFQLPATTGGEGHSIKLPNDEKGLSRALLLINDRAKATAANNRIGHKASPTKYQLEREAKKLIKESKKKAHRPAEATAEQRASTKDILKGLGII